MFTTNPRKALDDAMDSANQDGWNAVYFSEHQASNVLVKLIQFSVLILTLFLWTFGAGYMVLLEKEV